MPGEPGLAPPGAARRDARSADRRADRRFSTHCRRRCRSTVCSICHATPRNDVDIFTERTPEERLAPIFAGVDADVVVCGHTHMQFERTIAGKRVINSGSVGMPYEDEPRRVLDARPRAPAHASTTAPLRRSVEPRRGGRALHRTWALISFRSAASAGRTGSTARSSSKARAIAPTRSRPARRRLCRRRAGEDRRRRSAARRAAP